MQENACPQALEEILEWLKFSYMWYKIEDRNVREWFRAYDDHCTRSETIFHVKTLQKACSTLHSFIFIQKETNYIRGLLISQSIHPHLSASHLQNPLRSLSNFSLSVFCFSDGWSGIRRWRCQRNFTPLLLLCWGVWFRRDFTVLQRRSPDVK